MHPDTTNEYRPLLEEDLLEFMDRVDTPWDALPDFAEYNDLAYRKIQSDLARLRKIVNQKATQRRIPHSRGILILGEAGTGKTHILMRAARNLARKNHICFVRKPNDEDAVAQHIWANIVESLGRHLSGSGQTRSQLDDLLAHVFSSVLIDELEQDVKDDKNAGTKQRWIDKLRSDPFNLFGMLGEGEKRTANMRQIRNRTLGYLQRHHPEVDQRIAHALITYCLAPDETRKRIVLTWLSGQDIDEKESKWTGLPQTWVSVEDGSSNISVGQQREEQSLRAIQTIGILSTHYQPLILAFDQLEGLRGEQRLTQRWGDAVREIFTMAPNYIIVTCLFPSLWNSWFEAELDESVTQRISQKIVKLEPFEPWHGTEFLKKQFEKSVRTHRLPSDIYPFAEDDVTKLCGESKSPRLFMQNAKEMFETWLDDSESQCSLAFCDKPSIVTEEEVDMFLQKVFEKFESSHKDAYSDEIQTELDFFGRIRSITQTILASENVQWNKATYGHYVMPPGIVMTSKTHSDSLCIAVANSSGRAFTSRMRNLVSALGDGDEFKHAIVLRDERRMSLTAKGSEYLKAFNQKKGHFLAIDENEYAQLNALYDMLVAIEEHNYSIGTYEITKDHFREFVRNSGVVKQIQLFQELVALSPCFERNLTPALKVNENSESKSSEPLVPHLESSSLEKTTGALEVDFDTDCKVASTETLDLFFDELECNGLSKEHDGELVATAIMEENLLTTKDLAASNYKETLSVDHTKPSINDKQDLYQQSINRDASEQGLNFDFSCHEEPDDGEAISENVLPQGNVLPQKDKLDATPVPPAVRCLIGDTKLDSSHVSILGELVDEKGRLGISLAKPQCIGILGYMGSGKSYALGVLIENALLSSSPLVQCKRPLSVIAFNYRKNASARFEYASYAQPNSNADEVHELISRYNTKPSGINQVNIFGYKPELARRQHEYQGVPTFPIQFRADELEAQDWEILMKPPTPQTEYMDIVRTIIQDLYYKECLTFRNLETSILDDERFSESQRQRAKNRLGFARKWLVDNRSYEWSDIISEGSLNVFDLRTQTMTGNEALKLCLVITNLMRREARNVNKMIVFDEAHEYVDSKELVGELENAITQIRHDGLSFVLASQFPRRIPGQIFKYLATRLVFKLPTTDEINYLQKMAPNLKGLSPELVSNLGLAKGICFIQTDDDCTDKLLSKPLRLKIRPRCSQHGGATVKNS